MGVDGEASGWEFTFAHEAAMVPGNRGRLFAPQGELRWRQVDSDSFALVFLGTSLWQGLHVLQDASTEITGLEPRPFTHRLWGEWNQKLSAWVEQRIPHHLRYPGEGRFLEVRGLTLHDPISGKVFFQRYMEVRPWSKEGAHA